METSLHRQLKDLYAEGGAATEVTMGEYRIDVVAGEELIEIQHGSLAAIRDKVEKLVADHRVRVVKPIVARKRIVRQDQRGGKVLSRRLSPKRGSLLNVFDELIYFRELFPHPRLLLDVVLVEIEEWRYPGHGKRRRRRANDHRIEDQLLLAVVEGHCFRTARDLSYLLPEGLPDPFHTGDLAAGLSIERWLAQRIAYCLRHAGTLAEVGKQGNARLYSLSQSSGAA